MGTSERSRTLFWPGRSGGTLAYAVGWLTFSLGYGAMFLLGRTPSLARATDAAFHVVLPAAGLGLGVVWLCRLAPFPPARRVPFAAFHVAGALAYPIAWMAVVSGWGSLERAMHGAELAVSLPPSHIAHWHFMAGVFIYITLVTVTYAFDYGVRAEARRRQAELDAIRAQLNPHFLFNTLHSLLALVRSDGAEASQAIERFASLLRYSLSVQRGQLEQVALAEEWAFTRNYLSLEQLRLGERLRLDVTLEDDALECRVPAFLLQPLVENAVRYAVAPRADGGTIRIDARRSDDSLRIEVLDDGPGSAGETSFGVGLQAARARLENHYGDRAHFTAAPNGDAGFRVTIDVPLAG